MEESDKLQFRLDASLQAVQSWVCDCIVLAEAAQPKGLRLVLVRRSDWQTVSEKTSEKSFEEVAISQEAECFSIYATKGREGATPDELVLTVTFYPAPASPKSSTARLEILLSPRFPLRPYALVRSFQARFPHARRSKSPAPEASHRGRSRPGAPLLACNAWLEEQLAQLDYPEYDYQRLYWGWMKRYYLLRGYFPADPRRSFRKAVVGCLRRLRAEEDY